MKARLNITLSDILKEVKETQILFYYLGYSAIKGNIKSPIHNDTRPSFSIKEYNGSIRYKDFGGNGYQGNLYDLLSKVFNKTYLEVLDMIYKDLDKIKKSPETLFTESTKIQLVRTSSGNVKKSENISLKVIIRPWKDYDTEFWKQFGITIPFLTACNNYAISHIILEGSEGIKKIPAEKYAYAYVEFKDGKSTIKVYQPFSTDHKWSNKHDPSVWDLWNKLPPTGDILIITSSRKDAMCIWENIGIPSTSLQAESYLPKPQVIEELKRRFKNIYLLYDNDYNKDKNWGKQFAKKLSEAFDIPMLLIPSIFKTKDPSDFYKKYGKEAFKKLIKNLLNNSI